MGKIYIYGAGVLGKKVLNVLLEQGHQVCGFIDSNKKGMVTNNNTDYPILSPDELKGREDIIVVISVLDPTARIEIVQRLNELELSYNDLEKVLYPNLSPVERNRKLVADYHVDQMDDYFVKICLR